MLQEADQGPGTFMVTMCSVNGRWTGNRAKDLAVVGAWAVDRELRRRSRLVVGKGKEKYMGED